MLDPDLVYCERKDNRCKVKESCLRYTTRPPKEDKFWVSDFWQQLGKECVYENYMKGE